MDNTEFQQQLEANSAACKAVVKLVRKEIGDQLFKGHYYILRTFQALIVATEKWVDDEKQSKQITALASVLARNLGEYWQHDEDVQNEVADFWDETFGDMMRNSDAWIYDMMASLVVIEDLTATAVDWYNGALLAGHTKAASALDFYSNFNTTFLLLKDMVQEAY